jgi:hypothetical protein
VATADRVESGRWKRPKKRTDCGITNVAAAGECVDYTISKFRRDMSARPPWIFAILKWLPSSGHYFRDELLNGARNKFLSRLDSIATALSSEETQNPSSISFRGERIQQIAEQTGVDAASVRDTLHWYKFWSVRMGASYVQRHRTTLILNILTVCLLPSFLLAVVIMATEEWFGRVRTR